jgi:hypothetical protein
MEKKREEKKREREKQSKENTVLTAPLLLLGPLMNSTTCSWRFGGADGQGGHKKNERKN